MLRLIIIEIYTYIILYIYIYHTFITACSIMYQYMDYNHYGEIPDDTVSPRNTIITSTGFFSLVSEVDGDYLRRGARRGSDQFLRISGPPHPSGKLTYQAGSWNIHIFQ